MTKIKFHSQAARKIATKIQKPEKEVRI